MLSRPPATVSGAIGPAPPTRSPISFPSPFQHLHICGYLRHYEILFIWFFFLAENSGVRFYSTSLPHSFRPPFLLNTCIYFIMEQDSLLGKSGWKFPFWLQNKREFHVRRCLKIDCPPCIFMCEISLIQAAPYVAPHGALHTILPGLHFCQSQSFMKQQRQPKLLSCAYPVRN